MIHPRKCFISLKKNVYSTAVECNVICMSIKSFWFIVLFKYTVSFLILCLDDLSIVESGVFESTTIIVLLFLSFFISVSICFIYLGSPEFGV